MRKFITVILLTWLSSCVTIDPLPPVPMPDERPSSPGEQRDTDIEQTFPERFPDEDSPAAEEERVAIATPQSVDRPPQQKQQSAAASLRGQAHAAVAHGDNDKAIRYLERALRIAPREAQTYYDFANVRLNQQRPEEALQLARRGLGMHPDLSLRNDLEQLVQLSKDRLNR
ncbi:MAG: tetratricopeptide repeat protein [Pseudomonadales bacterium]